MEHKMRVVKSPRLDQEEKGGSASKGERSLDELLALLGEALVDRKLVHSPTIYHEQNERR